MATSALPVVGDVLGGAYRVVRRLGAGGMGAVYEVESVGTGERWAMKLMQPHLATDKEFTARFFREARASKLVVSPHVARVVEVGNLDDGSLFMTMELLGGIDLEHELKAKGALPKDRALGLFAQICEGVSSAHARGIVHRDLKPANIFLHRASEEGGDGGEETVKVLDFGVSKVTQVDKRATHAESLTQTQSTLGSPKYMSPEQLKSSRSADARSDIWSLGVILYRMLSARLPYEASSIGAYAVMMVEEQPVPLGDRAKDIAPELAAVVMKCLVKKPNERYQTVGELAAAIAPLTSGSTRALFERIANRVPEEPAPESTEVQLDAVTVPLADDLRREVRRKLAPARSTASPVSMSGAATVRYVPPQKRRRLWISGAAALLVGGALAFAWSQLRTSAPPADEPASSSVAADSERAPVDSAGPSSTPARASASSASPEPRASADPSASPDPSAAKSAPSGSTPSPGLLPQRAPVGSGGPVTPPGLAALSATKPHPGPSAHPPAAGAPAGTPSPAPSQPPTL